ncbi:hypothetical protein KBI23_24915 [bacterium]|nr:hypothetical protein [bacterium]MBP9810351.1 hypothetical protein [bacterium]
MGILLVLVLLFVAWLGGHALDYIFNQVEKAIKPVELEKEIVSEPRRATTQLPGKQPARLYLVPSATARH